MRCVRADVLEWVPDRSYGLWHDRAVYHFLVDDDLRQRYVRTMSAAVGPGGGVIVGTFAADGPEVCSGLPVRRYSADDLRVALGDRFEVVAARREEHVTPGGTVQPFTWIAGALS